MELPDAPLVCHVSFEKPPPIKKKNDPEEHVLVQHLNSTVEIPQQVHPGDAGFDLQAAEDVTIHPGETILVAIGLTMRIPEGYQGKIESRSGLAKLGIVTVGGVIDLSYRGPIKVILHNQTYHEFKIQSTDCIAQITFVPVLTQPLKEVSQLEPTQRGNQGFGSSRINAVQQDLKKKMDLKHYDTVSSDKHAYHLGQKLTNEQKTHITDVMYQYEDVLAVSFDQIRAAKMLYKH